MGEVVQHVTTPLALAAVVLLAGAGILRVILKRRTTVASKMTIRYGFGLAVILSALANISYVISARLHSESAISGTVRSSAGATLARAIIDVPAVGRGITDDNGSFWISVPASRARDSYDLTITLDGFEPTQMSTALADTDSLVVTLDPIQLTLDRVMTIPSDLMIAHLVGLAQVDVPIHFRNPMADTIVISDLRLRLTAPDGSGFSLHPRTTYFRPGTPPNPVLQQIELTPGQRFESFWSFMALDAEAVELGRLIDSELVNNPSFQRYGPQLGQHALSSSTTSRLKQFLEEHFIWSAGEWQCELSFSAAGIPELWRGNFTLTDDQVTAMKNQSEYLGFGFGIAFGRHLQPVGNAIPFHYVPARDAN